MLKRIAMRTYSVDLHNHSPHVSGDYRGPESTCPRDLVVAALDAGIDVLAISDHFSVEYAAGVAAAASAERLVTGRALTVLPGAELKVRWRDDEIHYIALFEPGRAAHRFTALQLVLGIPAGEDPSTLHRAVMEHDPVEVARAIDAVGGICHVAHADRLFGGYRLLDRPILARVLREAPIAAVELLDRANERAVRALSPRPVCCIRSSDAHAPAEIGRRRTDLVLSEPTFRGLRDALCACGVEA
ncbi:MAG TPA: PHP-associated domain-containing protein [Coriobacteriia bacterium]